VSAILNGSSAGLIHVKGNAGVGWHDASMVDLNAIPTQPAASVSFDPALIRKYDGFGPRYTSYPTANRFTEAFTAQRFVDGLLARITGVPMRPLSLYGHLPFCDTICYYCACNKVTTRDHGRASTKHIRYLAKELANRVGARRFDISRQHSRTGAAARRRSGRPRK
jgi:hypothetical protein